MIYSIVAHQTCGREDVAVAISPGTCTQPSAIMVRSTGSCSGICNLLLLISILLLLGASMNPTKIYFDHEKLVAHQHETVSLLIGLGKSISPDRLGEQAVEYTTRNE